jgi:DNA-binding NtrC family response regulator
MARREAVLIVDDDAAFREVYRELLGGDGFEVLEAGTRPDAVARFTGARALRLVILDLMLPPSGRAEDGAALCQQLLAERPGAKIIVVSGVGDVPLALDLVRRGAYDFLAKPVDPDVLLAVIARAAARLRLEDRVDELETTLATTARDASGLLGTSAPFRAALELCERAAPTDVPVLFTGASGTGKELFARHLHARSRRAGRAFVAVNCGALAPTLLESTLFGHKRGAFTGAVADAPGLFVEADGGTIFLDEIGDLEPALQVKLLRVLEAGELLPVGASKPTTVDVRVVSATHRPLAEMVAARSFRDDLYWRIRGIEVALPRLADRAGDLAPLAQHFLNHARTLVPGAGTPRLSAEALRLLERHAWPGNLRELRHEMQRALVMAAGREELLAGDLSPSLRKDVIQGEVEASAGPETTTLEQKIFALERRELEAALAATANNRSQAAERLGLSRQGLLNKLERHGLK